MFKCDKAPPLFLMFRPYQSCGLVVIVDINESDMARLNATSIHEGDIMATSLISVPNNLHMTASWRLLGDVKKSANRATECV